MLFAKRNSKHHAVKSLRQRFTVRFGHYLGHPPPDELSIHGLTVDIPTCYALLGEGKPDDPCDPTELSQTLHRLATVYKKQTGTWLEPEQVALAAIKCDVHNQARILKRHLSSHFIKHAELHCTTQTSYLRLALLANTLRLKQFSLSQPAPSFIQPPSCQHPLNKMLDDISITEIEACGRELREACTASLISNGINPDALQAFWRLRMRYPNSTTAVLLKCMPVDMMRDVFEAQHKQQFGFITPGEPILIEALEIEVKLSAPCRPGMPAENPYINRLMARWQANQCNTGESWKRVKDVPSSSANLSFLNCPVLKKMLTSRITKSTNLTMSDFFIKNIKKGVDETVVDN